MKPNKKIVNEKGQAMILVLILLLLGGLIIAPLLGFMGTGLKAGQVHEKKMYEFYAADAGVEDALWKLRYDPPTSYDYSYQLPAVNGMTVDVTIDDIDAPIYKITSTAGGTTIESYVSVIIGFWDGPVTEYAGNTWFRNQSEVPNGNIYVDGDFRLSANLTVNGMVMVEGALRLNRDAVINASVCAQGEVRLGQSDEAAFINGNVYTPGDVRLGADAVINGDVYLGGTLTLEAEAVINGTVYPYAGCGLPMSSSTTILTWESPTI